MHSLSVMRTAVVALVAIASTGSVSHARAATFIVNSTATILRARARRSPADARCVRRSSPAWQTRVATRSASILPSFRSARPRRFSSARSSPRSRIPPGRSSTAPARAWRSSSSTAGGRRRSPGSCSRRHRVCRSRTSIANLTVRGFPGIGVHVCGGVPPDCQSR